MARGERTCVVCGEKYIYCPNCKKGDPEETWRYMYHDAQCRDIFNACSNFVFGHKTAAEAKRMLEKYDMSNISKYNKNIRQNLSAIYAAPAENKPVEEKKDNNFHFNKNKNNNKQAD